jgi:hypothetical protein
MCLELRALPQPTPRPAQEELQLVERVAWITVLIARARADAVLWV